MKKENITFEQLALLSYLKFTVLDGVDMAVLMNMIKDTSVIEFDDTSTDYYIMNDGMIMLENHFVEKFYKNVDKELYDSLENTNALKYLDNINILEFVLRKIKMMGLGRVLTEDITENFKFLQLGAINRLYRDGMIIDYLHKDTEYEDYMAIKLTKRGELYLYLIDNKEEIEKFRELLRNVGYDENLLEAYLITNDLNISAGEVLTLSGFLQFCGEYDINVNSKEERVTVAKKTLKPLRQ